MMSEQQPNPEMPNSRTPPTGQFVAPEKNAAHATVDDDKTRQTSQSQPNPGTHRPVPRGPRVGYLLLGIGLIVVALWAGVAFHQPIRDGAGALRTQIAAVFGQSAPAGESATANQYYWCAMHKYIVQPKPGTCPVCGMDLEPVGPEKLSGEITIDPRIVQNMGVRVEAVTQGPLTQTIRTVGTVEYDETRVRDVNIKVNGWIERLHVASTGASVSQGQPLFDLYSPALFAAQEEMLLAQDNASTSDDQRDQRSTSGAEASANLFGAARTRLLYYDVTSEQIGALLERGTPKKAVTIQSPHEGVVVEKHANEGMHVTPGMRVYRIADLSQVWVMATIYEYQLPYVHERQTAMMTLPYLPGRTFEGEVDYIYPYMDKKTREVQVRLVFDNADGTLKPGMFANVKLRNTLDEQAILAPREAVIDTGERQVALVSTGGGTFEPRDVKLGPTTDDDQVQILEGLEPGEQVVTSGQFLIDSEAKARAALAKMIKGQAPAATQEAEQADQAGITHVPADANDALADAIEAYLTITDQLASDRFEAHESATALAQSLDQFQRALDESPANAASQTVEHVDSISATAQKLTDTTQLDKARQFTATISRDFYVLLKLTGVPANYDGSLVMFHCHMYQEARDGVPWLQNDGEPRNPYYGSRMLGCFEWKQALPRNPQSDAPTD